MSDCKYKYLPGHVMVLAIVVPVLSVLVAIHAFMIAHNSSEIRELQKSITTETQTDKPCKQ